MPLSRRRFLASSIVVLASGCARIPGRGDEPQTFGPGAVDVGNQILDPELRLSLPAGSVSPQFLESFEDRTGVRVSVTPQPSRTRLLVELGAGVPLDVAVADELALSFLISQKQVEPLARSLLPNRDLVSPPFGDPPADPGGRHSVPKDYTVVGYGLAGSALFDPADSWAGFFRMAQALPGRVAVPDDAVTVVGAALASLGLDWNSRASADLDAARQVLLPLKGLLVVGRPKPAGAGRILAAIGPGWRYVDTGPRVRFVVPREGSVMQLRSYCVPVGAPDPVSAHAWMNASLDPATAARETLFTRRASPVADANFVLPVDVLANPAIYPPARLRPRLLLPDVSEEARAARNAVWREVTG